VVFVGLLVFFGTGARLPHVSPRRTLEHRQTYVEEASMTTPAKPVPSTPSTMTRSEEVVAKHKKYIWPSVTNYYQKPLVADHAEMQHVWDVEGRKYLDFFGGILTVSVGHCNPRITSKVNAQRTDRRASRKDRADYSRKFVLELFH
jgi:4-aminobutyrate aminotransferase-like enzyme